jgi:hypothetical protein
MKQANKKTKAMKTIFVHVSSSKTKAKNKKS